MSSDMRDERFFYHRYLSVTNRTTPTTATNLPTSTSNMRSTSLMTPRVAHTSMSSGGDFPDDRFFNARHQSATDRAASNRSRAIMPISTTNVPSSTSNSPRVLQTSMSRRGTSPMSSSTRRSVQASMSARETVPSSTSTRSMQTSTSTPEIMPTSSRNVITSSEEVANTFTQTSYIQFGSLWETNTTPSTRSWPTVPSSNSPRVLQTSMSRRGTSPMSSSTRRNVQSSMSGRETVSSSTSTSSMQTSMSTPEIMPTSSRNVITRSEEVANTFSTQTPYIQFGRLWETNTTSSTRSRTTVPTSTTNVPSSNSSRVLQTSMSRRGTFPMSSSTRMSVQASMLAPGTVSSSTSTLEIMPTSARNMSEEVANSFTQTSYIQFGSLWETFKTVTKLSRVAMVENGECVICLEEWRKETYVPSSTSNMRTSSLMTLTRFIDEQISLRATVSSTRTTARLLTNESPATIRAVAMLPRVAMVEKGECVICFEEWSKSDMETELPCKHKYHFECVEKWLKIHTSCPQCRYKLSYVYKSFLML
ncbi:Zinc finger RING-type [Arabidopsis suecica]|uniref:RING-type E3 ubiquitin transferase n=1 Tax=Arabidopsis suecica TaxID=45249 RepID=A0A8T2G0T6_ARASU|nr:Zinc finger RING-type [Arabidopsis suecica]